MQELSFKSFGNSDVFYEEAKELMNEYPEKDWYIQENYRMWMSPGFGMDDNSIDLSYHWRKCKELVEQVEKLKE